MSEHDENDEFQVEEVEQMEEVSTDVETETEVEETAEAEEIDWKAEALKLKAILKRKTKKEADPQTAQTSNPTQAVPTDIVTPKDLLRTTKGYDDDALAQLEVIAKGKGISLIQAQDDPLFTGYLEKQEAEKKAQAAKLGASKGSGRGGEKRTFTTPGLSDEDHKAMWKEKQGL
jgi:hypothetical protein